MSSDDLNHAIKLAKADLQLQGLTLWTVTDLVEAIAYGRVHIAPGHDPALTAPTSAQEALDLAWELAHPVKEGQFVPEGTECLARFDDGYRSYETMGELITSETWTDTRTFDPLPDPEPDWLDAPAVLARHVKHAPDSRPSLWVNLGDGMWGHAETTKRATVWDLRDVTPLYPKEEA